MSDTEKIKKLVEDSGMITHLKTKHVLDDKKWPTLLSPYYHDSISDSVREIDLIAERPFFSDRIPRHSSVQLNVQLFIECKYIKHEIIFCFGQMDEDKAILAFAESNDLIVGRDVSPDELHYLNGDKSVAKVFSPNLNKEDVMYKALNQCLHSQIYYRSKGNSPILLDHTFSEDARVFNGVVRYPLIVCENFENFLRVDFDGQNHYSTTPLQNHFILEANYRDDYFLVDVVDLNYLERYLGVLEEEAKKLLYCYALKQSSIRNKT